MVEIEAPKRPETSLKIYETDGHWEESGYLYPEDWNAYARGYLDAAKGLIKLVEEHEFRADTFGYPIFFLVCHYLEIRMKEMMINGRDLIDEQPDFLRSHDLNKLWIECKRIIKIIDKSNGQNQLDAETRTDYSTIDHFIRELAIDSSAQSFRYPVDRNGDPLLCDPRIKSLNVHNLGIVLDWLTYYFEGFSTGIDQYNQWKREIASEFSQEEREWFNDSDFS
ncbi:MAG: hypothetical protein ABFC38_06865 [Methanospirillum sp.]